MPRTFALSLSLLISLATLNSLPISINTNATKKDTQESSQATTNLQQNRLAVKLKAKLTNYKGPSQFRMRRSLMTFSPDGQLLAISGRDRTVTVWDTKTGELKTTLKGGSKGINGFTFSPDGKLAATRDIIDKRVRLWDTATWQLKTELTGRKRDLETKLKAGVSMAVEEGYAPVVFSPDGNTVLSEREDDIVDVWDVSTGQSRAKLNHDTHDSGTKDFLKSVFTPFGLNTQHFLALQTDYSSDGRYIVTVNGDKAPKLWDAATGNLKATLPVTERIYRAEFSPDGRTLATTELQGLITLWDVETGQSKGTVTKKRREYYFPGFEFSPDGRLAVTFHFEDTKLWDVANGKLKLELPKSKANDAAFSPDGRWLATASDDGKSTARIWNVETGEVKTTMPPSNDHAEAIIFSPDARIVVTTNDKGAKLWDAATGELLASLDEARYPVAFSPDGNTLATGGRKDTAMLWEIMLQQGGAR
jgi:WD40 repeat protein